MSGSCTKRHQRLQSLPVKTIQDYRHLAHSHQVWRIRIKSGTFASSLATSHQVWRIRLKSGAFASSLAHLHQVWHIRIKSGEFASSLANSHQVSCPRNVTNSTPVFVLFRFLSGHPRNDRILNQIVVITKRKKKKKKK